MSEWEEAWKHAGEELGEGKRAADIIVVSLAELIIEQVRRSPANTKQALAALTVAKAILEL